MTNRKLDYIKAVERLDAQFCLLCEQLDALNIAMDAKHKEYLKAKKKVLMLDPDIAKEDAMWKEFMKNHGTPRKKED